MWGCRDRAAIAPIARAIIMSHYILVVDDEAPVRYSLRCQLEVLGYEVEEAESGPAALKAIARRKPDLMILDILMSPLSGWEVLELLRETPATRHIRVLLLTALANVRDEAQGWHRGCDWYQIKQKPLSFDDLPLIVERLLAIQPQDDESALPDSAPRRKGEGQ